MRSQDPVLDSYGLDTDFATACQKSGANVTVSSVFGYPRIADFDPIAELANTQITIESSSGGVETFTPLDERFRELFGAEFKQVVYELVTPTSTRRVASPAAIGAFALTSGIVTLPDGVELTDEDWEGLITIVLYQAGANPSAYCQRWRTDMLGRSSLAL